MWNLPNSLTLLRIGMVPFLVVVLLTRFPGSLFWGLAIFLLAALTDLADGMIARRTSTVTVAGTLLDPIADKLLMSAAFISLVELDLAPAWMVVVMVAREFAVTGLRQVAQTQGVVIAANWWGKAKTAAQIVAVCAVIIAAQVARLDPVVASLPWLEGTLSWIAYLSLWVAVVLTLGSLLSYFLGFWNRVVRETP
jgi:CDP-diacylglycerol--glycerol-3-phosphate 3-phosphatidyltransferase